MTIIENKMIALKKLKLNIENKELQLNDYDLTLKNDKGIIKDIFQKDGKKYKTDYHCSYCQWKDLCHANTLKKIKDYKFYIDGAFI